MKTRRSYVRPITLFLLLWIAVGPGNATPPGVHSDFNGDGKADVPWRSLATGSNVTWRSGSSGSLQVVAGVSNQAWGLVGVGDFDGDGKADLFWRNGSAGQNGIWRSADLATPQQVAGVTDLAWSVAGIGDFDGDGVDDVFWRNLVTGSNTIWRSADHSLPKAVSGVSNLRWRIVGIGDFDNDGKSDVLWRNVATGANVIWRSGSASTPQAVIGVSNMDWRVVAVGDFDGDGKSDVLWRNLTTGANTIWKSANAATQQAVTPVASQQWQVAASGDYDGDGRSDLFWRNYATGADTIWRSANFSTPRATGAVTDMAWVVVPREPSTLTAMDSSRLASPGPSPFGAGCDGVATSGTLYVNAEVEPTLVVNPLDPNHLIGAWQQDRWSNGSSRGIVSAFSTDGGVHWTRRPMPFSRCGGGNAANGGDYARVTDPWLAIAPNGIAYLMALGSNGGGFTTGSSNAMLVSRSIDQGRTWGAPITLIRDGAAAFNDKNSITADPTTPAFAYAVWDRLLPSGNGATWFSRTVNGGQTWEAPRSVYDPGGANQTLGNLIVVLPNGSLVNLFTEIAVTNGTQSSVLAVIRSFDKGLTWSAPIRIADQLAVGARDPHTGALVRDGADLAQISVAPSGHLYVVWQDARFSGGNRDGIALSRSTDGGLHWSAPTRVNTATGVPAFIPSVHVLDDNTVGITYYDFRSNTPDTTSLLTDYWLIRSSDGGVSWRETRVSAPFDLDSAPNAGGYFLGDYQSLQSRGAVFVPFFVKTNGNTNNRTDVFSVSAASAAASAMQAGVTSSAQSATRTSAEITPEFRARVDANLARVLRRRIPTMRTP